MHLSVIADRFVPASTRTVLLPLRLLAGLLVAALVVAAFWVGGAVVSDDFTVSMIATTVLVGAVGLAALLVAMRWRTTAVPVLTSFALVSVSVGGYLLVTSTRDVTVNETVVMADTTPMAGATATAATVATGMFASNAHETTGTASLVRTGGRHVLTLANLDTDPGPDLRVYLVAGDGTDVSDHLDLGKLKGNKGTQQYEVPVGVDVARYGSVVIWCRAFTVAFGTAVLM